MKTDRLKHGPQGSFVRHRSSLFAILILVFYCASQSVWAVGKRAASEHARMCNKSLRPEVAINHCTQVIDSGRFSGKQLALVYYRRGNAYNEMKKYDRAIEDYDAAIRLNPSHDNAFSNRGVAYARKRDYDRAIKDYDAAIRLNPNHADAFSNRGVAYARKRDYDRAILNYDAAIRLNPKHAQAFYDRGNAHRRRGDNDRAIQDYNEAIRLNPNHANAFSNRGVAYGQKGNYDLAIQSYDAAIKLNRNHINAFYNRGNAYRRKGNYEGAVRDYDQVILLNPDHANAYASRGLVRFYQAQFTIAEQDFSQAVRFAPTNLYRIILLYLAQARAGSHAQEALAQATRELDLGQWPGPIVSLYLGKVTERVVFDAVADDDATKQLLKRCQAYFYIGQQLLIRHNQSEAAKMFQETIATKATTHIEYEAAEIELQRLGN